MELIFSYIAIGMVVGFLSGMFGIGGSAVNTIILKVFFGLPDLIALATPLPVVIPTAISGVYGYWKKNVIRKDVAFYAILGGLPATIAGAYATKFINSIWLMVLTGVFAIYLGIRLLKDKKYEKTETERKIPIQIIAVLTGIIAGGVSGLLALGGGVILIPAFILLLGLTMQEAAATSLLCIAFFALPGTIVHSALGHINWNVTFLLTLGVIPTGYLGAKAGMAIKSKQLQMMFSIFLISFGIYFILKQLHVI